LFHYFVYNPMEIYKLSWFCPANTTPVHWCISGYYMPIGI